MMTKETKLSAFILAAVFFFVTGMAVFSAESWAAADTSKGKRIYMANCSTCHGDKGDGNGMAASALNPKPRNFTDQKEMKDIDDKRMHKSIAEGRPGTSMMAWKGTLKPADIDDVTAYIRTLMKK